MPGDEPRREPEQPDWGSVGMSPEAKQECEEYIRWIREDFAEAKRTRLKVLVWGPGTCAGGKMFEKREQIRDRLRRNFDDAALFSEELDEVCRQFSASSRVNELFQAHRADFILALYSSPGSIAEVHDMAKTLGWKMLIFIDSRHVESYGFKGLLGELKSSFNNVETFEYPTDIDECHLMAAVVNKLEPLRIAKWLAKKMGVVL
jgi:hypothetical protein